METENRPSSFTAGTFFEWALEQPGKQLELVNGRVVQYPPLSVDHLRAGEDAVCALREAIDAAGVGCEVFRRGAGVRVDDLNVHEPDAVVCCGPSIPGDAVELVDPVIIVDVASRSTASTERGKRQQAYFKLGSVRHYLVVDLDARAVVHHRRNEAGAVERRIVRQGMIELEPPGLTVRVETLFASTGR